MKRRNEGTKERSERKRCGDIDTTKSNELGICLRFQKKIKITNLTMKNFLHITNGMNVSTGNSVGVGYVAVCLFRAGFRGGNANNGSNDGLGYVNVNNAVGNNNTNIGARLSAFLYGSFHKISRNDATYSNHRTVGELMFRTGVSKFVVQKLKALG